MRALTDCHVHTQRCGHATGSVEEYVRAAQRAGLYGVVVAEHLALPDELDPDRRLSMPACDLEDYLVEVDFARKRFPDVQVVTGLEADYLPGREAMTAAALAEARGRADGATVVLGSVHFLGEWAFDDPHNIGEWEHRDIDEVWREYFHLWNAAATSGLFDVMAHPDLVKKFGYFPSFDPLDLYLRAARTASDAGVRIEVSTAGLRKPVRELYPSSAFLNCFRQAGVAATVGSDAHRPDEVGFRIAEACDALAAAGYETVSFPDGSGGWEELVL